MGGIENYLEKYMNYAIILSNGIGSRMNSLIPKQYIEIDNQPILIYTVKTFQESPDIDKIIIVASKEWHEPINKWMKEYNFNKFVSVIEGGESRQASIFEGLNLCIELSKEDNDLVIIHDAVRPLVSKQLIFRCLDKLRDSDGVMPVIPVTDTIYLSDDGKTISSLLNRDKLCAGQAPEAFNLRKYYEINKDLSNDEFSKVRGSSEIAFKNGLKVSIVDGDENNIKITTPNDIEKFINIKEKLYL